MVRLQQLFLSLILLPGFITAENGFTMPAKPAQSAPVQLDDLSLDQMSKEELMKLVEEVMKQLPPHIKELLQEIGDYYPEPQWLAERMFSLKPQDCDQAFEVVVGYLRNSMTIHTMFCDKPEEFHEEFAVEAVVQFCSKFNDLINRTGIDISNVLSEQGIDWANAGFFRFTKSIERQFWFMPFDVHGLSFVSVRAYWQMNGNNNIYEFYAVYAHYLAKMFLNQSNKVLQGDNIGQRMALFEKVMNTLIKLTEVVEFLRGSSYERVVEQQVERYRQLLEVLGKNMDTLNQQDGEKW